MPRDPSRQVSMQATGRVAEAETQPTGPGADRIAARCRKRQPGQALVETAVTLTAHLPHLFGLLGSGWFTFTRPVTKRTMLPNQNRPPGKRGGQALVEIAITVVLFLAIALGVMTFGHAVMTWNMIRHAARDGARVAATWPNRGAGGALTNTGSIVTLVQREIATVSGEPFAVNVSQDATKRCNGNGLTCSPSSGCPSGQTCVPVSAVRVNVQGCVPYLFPILPSRLGTTCPSGQVGFGVNQTLTFDDEP